MQSPQRPEDGLELELQAVVGQAWMLGTELWSSGAASTLTVRHLSSLINKGMQTYIKSAASTPTLGSQHPGGKDDLELLVSCFHLLSAEITGLHLHTHPVL